MKDWTIIFSTESRAVGAFKYADIPKRNRQDIVVLDKPYQIAEIMYQPATSTQRK